MARFGDEYHSGRAIRRGQAANFTRGPGRPSRVCRAFGFLVLCFLLCHLYGEVNMSELSADNRDDCEEDSGPWCDLCARECPSVRRDLGCATAVTTDAGDDPFEFEH